MKKKGLNILESLNLLIRAYRLDHVNGFETAVLPLVDLANYLEEVAGYISDLETEVKELRRIRSLP